MQNGPSSSILLVHFSKLSTNFSELAGWEDMNTRGELKSAARHTLFCVDERVGFRLVTLPIPDH